VSWRLQEAGWHVAYGPHTIITLGYAGSIRKQTGDLLRTLGCKDGQAGICMSRLHSLATKYAAAILPKRRWLENNMPRSSADGHTPAPGGHSTGEQSAASWRLEHEQALRPDCPG
jgi:hypothetical protein